LAHGKGETKENPKKEELRAAVCKRLFCAKGGNHSEQDSGV